MKRLRISNVLGVVAALIGAWWLSEVFVAPLVKNLMDPKNPGGFIFIFTVSPLMALPGVALIGFGVSLVHSKVMRNFKGVVGWLAFLGADAFATYLSPVNLFSIDREVWEILSVLISTLLVIPIYVALVNKLMEWDGCPIPGYRALIGKGVIWIVSFELWGLGIAITRYHAELKTQSGATEAFPSLTGFGITLAVVFIFYHGAISILGIDKPASRTPTTSSKESSSMGV